MQLGANASTLSMRSQEHHTWGMHGAVACHGDDDIRVGCCRLGWAT